MAPFWYFVNNLKYLQYILEHMFVVHDIILQDYGAFYVLGDNTSNGILSFKFQYLDILLDIAHIFLVVKYLGIQ